MIPAMLGWAGTFNSSKLAVKNSHHHKTWLGSQLHQVHAVNSASEQKLG